MPDVGPAWKCPDCGFWMGSFIGWADLQTKILAHENECNVRRAQKDSRRS